MSETRHTPGPWQYNKSDGIIESEYGDVAIVTGSMVPDDETVPNGLLLAAAPALLEACKAVIRKDKKSLLADFAYQGAEGGKHHAEKMGKFYDGYNKCLDEVTAVLKPAIALAEKGAI